MINVERIDKMMEQKNMGPGQLATYSGVAYDTIYKIRVGERVQPRADIVAKLARTLGCSIEYLMGMVSIPDQITDTGAIRVYEPNQIVLTVEDVDRREKLREVAEFFERVPDADAELIWQMTKRIGAGPAMPDLVNLKDRLKTMDEDARHRMLVNMFVAVEAIGGVELRKKLERRFGLRGPDDTPATPKDN